jgi:hypothetical protein
MFIDPNEDEKLQEDSDKLEDMKDRHPGYSDEQYNAGIFLGTDFPYIAGDPGL